MNDAVAPEMGTSQQNEKTRTRKFLTEPEEWMLMPCNPLEMATRYADFTAITGLTAEQGCMSAMVPIPMPRYRPRKLTQGEPAPYARQFDTVEPSFLWHPFMWLPHEMTMPRVSHHDDGRVDRVEDLEAVMVRIILEVAAAGLYDEESGEWVDILALHGLDIDDPQTLERCEAWLLGADDEILDNIDLTDVFADRAWAAPTTDGLLPALYGASVNRLAEDMLTVIEFAADPSTYSDPVFASDTLTPRKETINSGLIVLSQLLGDFPVDDLEVPTEVDNLSAALAPFLEDIDAFTGTEDDFIDQAVAPVQQLLRGLANETAGHVDALLALIAAITDAAAAETAEADAAKADSNGQ